jgi:hypothetical protein
VDHPAFQTTDDLPTRANGANVSNGLDCNLGDHLHAKAGNDGVRKSDDVTDPRQRRP